MTEKKKIKQWKYHTSHSYTTTKDEYNIKCTTQLYQTGVYAYVEGLSSGYIQTTMKPSDMVKLEKGLRKDQEAGLIKDLEFGTLITVIDEGSGYKRKEE